MRSLTEQSDVEYTRLNIGEMIYESFAFFMETDATYDYFDLRSEKNE